MGQSIDKPNHQHLQNPNSRLSVRSLQGSSRESATFVMRNSNSLTKFQHKNDEQPIHQYFNDNYDKIKINQLSSQKIKHSIIKEKKNSQMQNSSFCYQPESQSPNFAEVYGNGEQYSFWQCGVQENSNKQKFGQSSNQAHPEITISFSKTKNHTNNIFQDEPLQSKQNLKQILENEEDSFGERECNLFNKTYFTGFQELNEQKKSPKMNRENKGFKQELKTQNSKFKSKIQQFQYIKNNIGHFNDYDIKNVSKKQVDNKMKKFRKNIQLTKNMCLLKQRIIQKANKSPIQQQLAKKSLRSLSKSLRSSNKKLRTANNSENRSFQSKELTVNNTNKQEINTSQSIQKSQQIVKPVDDKLSNINVSRQSASQLYLFNGEQAYFYQNSNQIKSKNKQQTCKTLNASKGTQSSITEFSNKLKNNKNSTKIINFCEDQYQLKCTKPSKNGVNSNNKTLLRQITSQVQLCNNLSKALLSINNKQNHRQHKLNCIKKQSYPPPQINAIQNYKQYLQKRHKSLESKNTLKSKNIVIF